MSTVVLDKGEELKKTEKVEKADKSHGEAGKETLRMVQMAIDWIQESAVNRMIGQSWGEQRVTLSWERGEVTGIRFDDGIQVKRQKILPGKEN